MVRNASLFLTFALLALHSSSSLYPNPLSYNGKENRMRFGIIAGVAAAEDEKPPTPEATMETETEGAIPATKPSGSVGYARTIGKDGEVIETVLDETHFKVKPLPPKSEKKRKEGQKEYAYITDYATGKVKKYELVNGRANVDVPEFQKEAERRQKKKQEEEARKNAARAKKESKKAQLEKAGKGDEKKAKVTAVYKKPSLEGLHFAELFDTDPFIVSEGMETSRWVKSSNEMYTGKWLYTERNIVAIQNDYGLKLASSKSFHAAATRLPKIAPNIGKPFVLQYEARAESQISCGGFYIKLLNMNGAPVHTLSKETPFVVMFGPDRCGVTNNAIKFLLKYQHKDGHWTDHELIEKVPPGSDFITHLYTLSINPDNSFEIYMDLELVAKGDLYADLAPPISGLKELDDPTDVKPDDWVEIAKIPDPNAVKPADWDESEPFKIPDVTAVMPAGWLEEEAPQIPDISATKPDTWDDTQGEWHPPMIPNPKCADAPGCGPWKRPMVANPKYKGKWNPPMIRNPSYKGVWRPRSIPNPDYFYDPDVYVVKNYDTIGFELWNVEPNIIFDNIIITDSLKVARRFADETWTVRNNIEMYMGRVDDSRLVHPEKPSEGNALQRMMADVQLQFSVAFEVIKEHQSDFVTLIVTALTMAIVLSFMRARSRARKVAAEAARQAVAAESKAVESGAKLTNGLEAVPGAGMDSKSKDPMPTGGISTGDTVGSDTNAD